MKTRPIGTVGKPQEYEIKELPERISNLKLQYEKAGFLEIAWFRAGQAFDSAYIYSKVALSIILLALKLESITQSLGDKMNLIDLLKQRRIWAAIIGTLGIVLEAVGVTIPEGFLSESPLIISTLISGILTLISFFKPKA